VKSEAKKGWGYFVVSLGIIGCLVLQGMATFTMNWRFYSYYYPFLYYPMYSTSHFKGERINVRHLVFAIFEDSTEQEILPQDLGLNFWEFEWGFKEAIVMENRKKLQTFLQPFRDRKEGEIESLRLENYRLVLTDEGAAPAPPEVLKTVEIKYDLPGG